MTETCKTKLLPVAASGRGEFLVPCPSARGGSGFLGLRSGRRYEQGSLSYLGKEIGPTDILKRLSDRARVGLPESEWLNILTSFLGALAEFKVGNLVTATCGSEGEPRVVLVLVAKHREVKRKNLPA